MTTDPRRQNNAAALKGSWEALHAEAVSLSRQANDEAMSKYEFLIQRLTRLPQSRRDAQEQRLQSILEQSVLGLQSYFARRNRLDDMASCDEEVLNVMSDDALSLWRENQARAYWWQGRHQEAINLVQVEAEKLPFDVELRWLLFSILLDDNRIEEADNVRQSLLVELQELFKAQGLSEALVEDVNAQIQAKERLEGGSESNQVSLQFGLLHFLQSCIQLELENWQEAADAFAKAAKVSDAYGNRWHLIYRTLVLNNQGRLAQRALNRESSPVSQGFWRGLSGFYAGDSQGAATEWRRVTQVPLEEVTLSAVGDWILAHYYLDAVQPDSDDSASEDADSEDTASTDTGSDEADADDNASDETQPSSDSPEGMVTQKSSDVSANVRQGLQVALNLLGQQNTQRDPLVLGLAALGWGMSGKRDHLQRNLRHATEILRASLQDNKLSVFNWYFFRDLLPSDLFCEVEEFFHKPMPGQEKPSGQ